MTNYQIDISRRIRREIEELPGHMRQRVKREIAKLARNPRPDYAVELRGNLAGRFKIRFDQFRLVYRIDDDVAIVQVLKVGMKQDAFYEELG